MHRRSPFHSIHLILHYRELLARRSSIKGFASLVVFFVDSVAVVTAWEITMDCLLVALVPNEDVIGSKAWTTNISTPNRFVFIYQGHFLF